jgi:hypothetical protein
MVRNQAIFCFSLYFLLAPVKKDDPIVASAKINFTAVLNGANEPRPVTTTAIVYHSTRLPPAKEADLLNNLYYINLKSAAYITGEIRGQLVKK